MKNTQIRGAKNRTSEESNKIISMVAGSFAVDGMILSDENIQQLHQCMVGKRTRKPHLS